jgi:hypothetical protein
VGEAAKAAPASVPTVRTVPIRLSYFIAPSFRRGLTMPFAATSIPVRRPILDAPFGQGLWEDVNSLPGRKVRIHAPLIGLSGSGKVLPPRHGRSRRWPASIRRHVWRAYCVPSGSDRCRPRLRLLPSRGHDLHQKRSARSPTDALGSPPAPLSPLAPGARDLTRSGERKHQAAEAGASARYTIPDHQRLGSAPGLMQLLPPALRH